MRELLALARGLGALVLTGLGLLVVLRGDGAATHMLAGSVLIATGAALVMLTVLFETIDGRCPAPRRQEHH